MPKRHAKRHDASGNGAKMDHIAKVERPGTRVTWANVSDQIQAALACLEADTEAGLLRLKSRIEAVGREATEVGLAAKATTKREP